MEHETFFKDVMGALYGVRDKVNWLRDSVATQRGLQSLWSETKEITLQIESYHKEATIELSGITQSLSFIKDNSVSKEEFQSLRRELFEDIAYLKKIFDRELSKKIDTLMNMQKEHEIEVNALLAKQDIYDLDMDLEDPFDDEF